MKTEFCFVCQEKQGHVNYCYLLIRAHNKKSIGYIQNYIPLNKLALCNSCKIANRLTLVLSNDQIEFQLEKFFIEEENSRNFTIPKLLLNNPEHKSHTQRDYCEFNYYHIRNHHSSTDESFRLSESESPITIFESEEMIIISTSSSGDEDDIITIGDQDLDQKKRKTEHNSQEYLGIPESRSKSKLKTQTIDKEIDQTQEYKTIKVLRNEGRKVETQMNTQGNLKIEIKIDETKPGEIIPKPFSKHHFLFSPLKKKDHPKKKRKSKKRKKKTGRRKKKKKTKKRNEGIKRKIRITKKRQRKRKRKNYKKILRIKTKKKEKKKHNKNYGKKKKSKHYYRNRRKNNNKNINKKKQKHNKKKKKQEISDVPYYKTRFQENKRQQEKKIAKDQKKQMELLSESQKKREIIFQKKDRMTENENVEKGGLKQPKNKNEIKENKINRFQDLIAELKNKSKIISETQNINNSLIFSLIPNLTKLLPQEKNLIKKRTFENNCKSLSMSLQNLNNSDYSLIYETQTELSEITLNTSVRIEEMMKKFHKKKVQIKKHILNSILSDLKFQEFQLENMNISMTGIGNNPEINDKTFLDNQIKSIKDQDKFEQKEEKNNEIRMEIKDEKEKDIDKVNFKKNEIGTKFITNMDITKENNRKLDQKEKRKNIIHKIDEDIFEINIDSEYDIKTIL
ncbi:e3 ubiquitin-protein ligase rbbp6 [Anaeramoeba flamelloides]|uniref:E3 ubiquitin-protein ligase rbbp6 n=1 Tax=Anaeramoeba flamelloides TaxID=1746091 RepID=A0AAV7ZPP7_9EUKA|nr:e3 ubiquitin-protein ligase rbbp6 [Anaeramoeba flamelloides]